MKVSLWILVAIIALLRLIAAFVLPLTGDEAYYWEWSRRLAFGYIDHPAGVAWSVAAFRWLGSSAGVLRFGFWFCGLIATYAIADCAARIARMRGNTNGIAVVVAALLASIAPMAVIAFGTVSPDGPFLAGWSMALDLATILVLSPSITGALATGIAIGIALESRAFALALFVGILIALRRQLRSAFIVAATALVCCIPLLCWNATHDWNMIIFTFVGRHVDEGFSVLRPLVTCAEIVLAFGIGPAILVVWAGRIGFGNKDFAIPLWTSTPLICALLAIALMERVETYWFLGPYFSLSVVAAVLVAERKCAATLRMRIALLAPALFLIGILYLVILATIPLANTLADNAHLRLKKAGPFDIYSMALLARDAKAVAAKRHAIILSDGYGLSSLMDYYGGIVPIVIGYSWQGRELRHWYTDASAHTSALFVDKAPLSDRPDFALQFQRACGRVVPGPVFRYTIEKLPTAIFPTTWCLDMKPKAIATLRWEQTP